MHDSDFLIMNTALFVFIPTADATYVAHPVIWPPTLHTYTYVVQTDTGAEA